MSCRSPLRAYPPDRQIASQLTADKVGSARDKRTLFLFGRTYPAGYKKVRTGPRTQNLTNTKVSNPVLQSHYARPADHSLNRFRCQALGGLPKRKLKIYYSFVCLCVGEAARHSHVRLAHLQPSHHGSFTTHQKMGDASAKRSRQRNERLDPQPCGQGPEGGALPRRASRQPGLGTQALWHFGTAPRSRSTTRSWRTR